MLSACQVVDKIISRIFSFRLNTRIILKLARHKLTNFLPPTSKVCLHLNFETGDFLCYIAKLCLAWFSGHWLVVVVLKPFNIRHINWVRLCSLYLTLLLSTGTCLPNLIGDFILDSILCTEYSVTRFFIFSDCP